MFHWLVDLYSWFKSFWDDLPDKIKRQVIEAFVNAMEHLLRSYYRQSK